jgi:hypothetical protein
MMRNSTRSGSVTSADRPKGRPLTLPNSAGTVTDTKTTTFYPHEEEPKRQQSYRLVMANGQLMIIEVDDIHARRG